MNEPTDGDKTMTDEKEEQSGFKVTDRRMFDAEGQERDDEPVPDLKESPDSGQAVGREEHTSPPVSAPEESGETVDPAADGPGEKINFASFLLSLATTGMVHLGEIPEPTTGQVMENLEGARQMIEILTVLKEKTEGNLSSEELHLMDSLLYELRMKFLSKSNVIKL